MRALSNLSSSPLSPPLSDVTRAERRSLLLFSVIGVAIAKAGLIPSELPALGIELKPADRLTLLYLIVVILFYYLVAFFVYSRSDLKRRSAIFALKKASATDYIAKLKEHFAGLRKSDLTHEEMMVHYKQLSRPADFKEAAVDLESFSNARVLFDCHIPLLVGAFAISALLAETRGPDGWLLLTKILSTLLSLLAGIYFWKNLRNIMRFLKVQQQRIHRWRMERLLERLRVLPEDSPKRAALLNKAAGLFFKAYNEPSG